MKMDINIHGLSVMTFSFSRPYIYRLLDGFELHLPFNAKVDKTLAKDTIIRIFGANIGIRSLESPQRELGYARLEVPMLFDGDSAEFFPTLPIRLSETTVAAIDDLRREGDFELLIKLKGDAKTDRGGSTLNTDWTLHIARSDWLEMLSAAGVHSTILIEIRLPSSNADSPFHAASIQMKRAQQAFNSGFYGECVAACRHVYEEIENALSDQWRAAFKLQQQDSKLMTKQDREKLIAASAAHYTHLAHHSSAQGGDAHARADAKMIMAITASLLGNFQARHLV